MASWANWLRIFARQVASSGWRWSTTPETSHCTIARQLLVLDLLADRRLHEVRAGEEDRAGASTMCDSSLMIGR